MYVRIRLQSKQSRVVPLPGSLAVEPAQENAGEIRTQTNAASAGRDGLSASVLVALGILASRLSGLVRERVVAHYLGNSSIAGVFRAAIRIPNVLSNLFGEGVLSAAFVTVYSKLRAQGDEEEAEHVAAAVFAVLALACSVLVLLGMLATPFLIDVIAPGFHGDNRALTSRLVRILFPGTGMLVMSAWCLGVLNSHRQFLLSYAAPVVMNASMIAAPLLAGMYTAPERIAQDLAWAFVAGAFLQFLVQWPRILQLMPAFRPVLDIRSPHVQTVVRNFGPVFVSRGVVQLSAYIDQIIASFLGTVAVSTLGFAQVIALLPISLFSMAVSAAELPAMSSISGDRQAVAAHLCRRLQYSVQRISFLIVPSAVAFLFLGDTVAAALFQSGRFSYSDAVYVWAVLGGSAVGLLASSLGRLYSSAFYSLLDTRTPLRFAIVRVILTTVLGYLFALHVPRWVGIDQSWGVAGLTTSAGIAGWVEFVLLRSALTSRIGIVRLHPGFLARLWLPALGAGLFAFALKGALGTAHPLFAASVLLPLFVGIYFGGTTLLGVSEATDTLSRLMRMARLRS